MKDIEIKTSLLQSIVRAKTGDILSLRMAWDNLCTTCKTSGIPKPVTKSILSSFTLPTPGLRLVTMLAVPRDRIIANWESVLHLSRMVDRPLDEILASLEVFLSHPSTYEKKINLETVLGYLHCCAEAISDKYSPDDLPPTVERMLDTYGFTNLEK